MTAPEHSTEGTHKIDNLALPSSSGRSALSPPSVSQATYLLCSQNPVPLLFCPRYTTCISLHVPMEQQHCPVKKICSPVRASSGVSCLLKVNHSQNTLRCSVQVFQPWPRPFLLFRKAVSMLFLGYSKVNNHHRHRKYNTGQVSVNGKWC